MLPVTAALGCVYIVDIIFRRLLYLIFNIFSSAVIRGVVCFFSYFSLLLLRFGRNIVFVDVIFGITIIVIGTTSVF